MARAVHGALLISSLLALAACQTQRAQDAAPSPPAVKNAAAPPAVQPPPATFRPEPAPAPPPAAPSVSPPAAATTPTTATPAPKPSKPKAPIKSSAPDTAATPAAASPTAAQSATAPPATSPAAAPKPASLDLNGLEQRLKDTRAIGVFTKLSLKNQVDDLLDELREFHKGSTKTSQSVLRQKYDLLILKVLSLLQDGDPTLASAISSSREALWQILMDPNKFAKI